MDAVKLACYTFCLGARPGHDANAPIFLPFAAITALYFQGRDDQEVIYFAQMLLAKDFMLGLSEGPAQSGRAFNFSLAGTHTRVEKVPRKASN
jgi:hypothetical protein